jgi:hypothetical protein
MKHKKEIRKNGKKEGQKKEGWTQGNTNETEQ